MMLEFWLIVLVAFLWLGYIKFVENLALEESIAHKVAFCTSMDQLEELSDKNRTLMTGSNLRIFRRALAIKQGKE